MSEPLRWITLHPALVHLPLGILPVAVLAYGFAARQRSARFTFAADLAILCAGIGTGVAAICGVIAYVAVPWPGGLGPWPVVHVVLGAATTVSVLALAALRARARRTADVAGPAWAWSALGVTALAVATGWVGGDVLVFRSGVGVRAAGYGAQAAPLAWPARPPADIEDAMGQLRGAWGSATSTVSLALVQRPNARTFESIAVDARHLQEIAAWLASRGATAPRTEALPPGVGGAGRAGDADEAHAREGAPGRSSALGELGGRASGEPMALGAKPADDADDGRETTGPATPRKPSAKGRAHAEAPHGHGEPATHAHAHGEPSRPGHGDAAAQGPAAASAHGHDEGEAHGDESTGAHIREMAGQLLEHTRALEAAARQQDLPAVARALGETTGECAACHDHVRWHSEVAGSPERD